MNAEVDRTCRGYYYSELNELHWHCECGILGAWACDKFVKDVEKQKAVKQEIYDEAVRQRIEEGRKLFRDGYSACMCRQERVNADRTDKREHCDNIDRLVGYIDEMRKDHHG